MKKYRVLWNGAMVRFIELFLDIIVVGLSLFLVALLNYYMSHHHIPSLIDFIMNNNEHFPFVALYIFLSAIFFVIYKTSIVTKPFINVIGGIFLSLFLTNLTLLLRSFFWTNELALIIPIFTPVVLAFQIWIFIVYKFLLFALFFRFNRRECLIYGKKEEVMKFAKEFYWDKRHYKRLKYLVFEHDNGRIPKIFYDYMKEVDEIYIMSNVSSQNKNAVFAAALYKDYKEIYIVPKTYEIALMRSADEQIDDTMVFKVKSMHLSFEQRFLKRTMDLVLSSVGLVVAAIPMLVIAILVKLHDGGPILYRQTRLKRNSKPFQIIKFRSMKVNADKDTGPVQANVNDPRITRLGRFIRATRLDELPQLYNIFLGHMSFVGPRPLIEKEINETLKENPEFSYRFNVKPGLTGLSQVQSRYDIDLNERLRYDLLYVRKYNLWLDVKIIFLTFIVVFSKEAGLGRNSNLSLEDLLLQKNHRLDIVENGYLIVQN